MKYAKRAAVVVGIVVLTVLVLATPVLWVIDRQMQGRTDELRQTQRAELARLRERILEDQQVLAGHWLFAPGGGAGDASAVLAPRTGWRGRGLERPADPGVPPALIAQLKAWGPEWPTHVDDVDLEGVDLAWMKELARFDHWDLEAEGSPQNERPWRWYDAPIPDFIPLQAAAKVRLLQGIRTGAPADAVAEVRALARLSASTETLMGEMVGAALMGVEGKARLAASARGLDLSSWPAIPDDELARVKRTLWGAVALFLPLALEAEETPVADAIQVGRCTALLEGGANALFLRQFLGGRYSERYRQIGDAITTSPCRLKNLRRAWSGTDGEGEFIADADLFCAAAVLDGGERPPGCGALGGVVLLPFTKALIGEILLSMALPDYLSKYDDGKLPAAPADAPP